MQKSGSGAKRRGSAGELLAGLVAALAGCQFEEKASRELAIPFGLLTRLSESSIVNILATKNSEMDALLKMLLVIGGFVSQFLPI